MTWKCRATSRNPVDLARKSDVVCRKLDGVSVNVHGIAHDIEWSHNEIHIFKKENLMDKGGRNTVSSFLRVQEFLTQHPLSDAPATLGPQASELNDVIERLSTDSVDQEAGTRYVRAHVESQRKLRRTLYTERMLPISRVAREVFGATGMDKAFRMPKSAKVTQVLLAAAGAMAEVAEKEKDVFIQHGLPQDFIDQLKAGAKAIEVARDAKTENARRRVTATAAVKDQLKRGRKAVRLLDAILEPRLAKDPELLAAWRSAKRVPPQAVSATPAIAPAVPVAPAPHVTQVGAPQPSSTTEKAA